MAGIVFFRSRRYEEICSFYQDEIQLPVWLDQGTCKIFQSGNLLLGFCQADFSETDGIITLFFKSRAKVDAMYERHREIALSPPAFNPKYIIYHFFTQDPEGRKLEFQTFEHDLEPCLEIGEALLTRRSIRKYKTDPVSDELLRKVFELCRYSPTARNLQSYYYIVIREREIVQSIVDLRGPAGNPLLASGFAIAVCARGELSRRVIQDACIAAYHLLLAAHAYGLGTCWVTDMDRPEIKLMLGVPEGDYIACLSPIGYPDEEFGIPPRHSIDDFVRYIPG